MALNKLTSASEAIKNVKDGDVVAVGGFGLVGAPLTLIDALYKRGVRNLTIISNNLGEPGKGLGNVLRNGQIKKGIGSYFTSNPEVGEMYLKGLIELQVIPQGSFAEAIRTGGAGIGGFYTKTALGTELAKGKETREIDGEWYVLEKSLRANVALVKAHLADDLGNLVYYKTARNFNPLMATAADIVIAEVDQVVPAGRLSPEQIITPHLYVDYLVLKEGAA